ncbi:S-layer homology domain-containing protein [Anaerovirgula multivorans]|uniref:S-layer homology domain-containing protein n=1 Tax=Anaerovirgula multivorans TaxID=312168 RepID=A0A239EII3_9FIRM|nr:S-layer homology domain-containing protein [Anaerovirgula multivorans]SNS44078.1 S-layer homology domain-containing protein [Anaerovirgula multivorans]
MLSPYKKISIVLITIILLQLIPYQAFGLEALTPHPTYNGLENGEKLYQNIQFNDIENHWGKTAIQEAAALSLMTAAANQQFQPNNSLSRLEGLTTLVKAMGLEEEAQRLGEQQAPANQRNIVILSTADHWGKGYLQVALQNGIVTPQEANQITNLTPQQIENLQEQVDDRMTAYEDRDLTPAELTNLQNQIRDQLETRATWGQPVSRQQMAAWMARALNLEGLYANNMLKINQFNDRTQIDTEKLPLVEAILQKEIMSGTSDTNFSPRQSVTRGEMARMITKVQEELLETRGLIKKEGEILSIEDLQHEGAGKKVFTINNDDNSKNLIVTGIFKDGTRTSKHDFPVQKQGTLGLSNTLRKGDWIRYYINQNNEVIYGAVDTQPMTELEGFIETIDTANQQLIMTDFQNKRHILQTQPAAKIQINGKDTSLADLLYGMEVAVTLKNNKITDIQGYLEEDPDRHGYIPPGTRVKVGDVLFISSDTVEINHGGNRERYKITTNTRILRSERPANLFEIKTGDRVMLFFDDIYSPDIATIRVEDHERHLDGIYRGQIEQIDQRNKEVILKNVYTYQQGKWTKYSQDQVKLKAEGDLLYEGSTKVSLKDLSSRKDQEAYVAVENSYGVPRIAKLLLKQGSSTLHQSTISDIQYGTSRMVVDNVGFTFHEGTIVVQNNRLVDMLNLDLKQTVHVVGDVARGNRNASFVSIEYTGMLEERIDQTRLVIYRGTVADIYDYGITLGRLGYRLDYLKLEDNQWTETSGRRRLTLSEDTFIFDSELKKEIESTYFIDTRFIDPEDIEDRELRRRIENNFYLGKGAYFVVRETDMDGETYEEVLALNLTPKAIHEGGKLHIEHSAIGEIGDINIDNETITLNNVKLWNSLNKRWETSRTGETISTDRAVILLNDTPINKDELHKLRSKAKAYVVKSKNVSTGDDAYVIIVEQ